MAARPARGVRAAPPAGRPGGDGRRAGTRLGARSAHSADFSACAAWVSSPTLSAVASAGCTVFAAVLRALAAAEGVALPVSAARLRAVAVVRLVAARVALVRA